MATSEKFCGENAQTLAADIKQFIKSKDKEKNSHKNNKNEGKSTRAVDEIWGQNQDKNLDEIQPFRTIVPYHAWQKLSPTYIQAYFNSY